MHTNGNQRWRDRRDKYRRPDEQINTLLYEVAPIADDNTPKAFVKQHHYSASYPAARFRFGLYRGANLVGVAVYSVPMNYQTLRIFPGDPNDSVELGRLVLLDDVPGNGESWFVARTFELLSGKGIVGIISHSDPLPRQTEDKKRVVFPGHVGFCYQALNAAYLGRSNSHYQKLLPDGTILAARAISKIRAKAAGKPAKVCQGWEYGVKQLRQYGADEPRLNDLKEWLDHWLVVLTRSQYHPGNYRYAWILPKKLRDKMPPRLKYPKVTVRLDAA